MTLVEPKSANELALERTDFAVDRTVMAANRTLMAWVRTALSYISFGFTIYKFLQAVSGGEHLGIIRTGEPKRLGLLLIALGTASAIIGTLEYRNTIKRMRSQASIQIQFARFPAISGGLVALLGLFLFFTIIMHMEVL